ncbi:unnamed protein product, partial [Prorocentrum cordatum]
MTEVRRVRRRAQPQRPVAGTSGSCDSGVRFYAARSRAAKESASCFAIAERLHQFAVVDGARAGGEPSSREATQRCAQFCAGQLSRLVSYAFAEQARQGALGSEGAEAVAEAEASGAFDAWGGGAAQAPEVTRAVSAWASALQDGFALCEQKRASAVRLGAGGRLRRPPVCRRAQRRLRRQRGPRAGRGGHRGGGGQLDHLRRGLEPALRRQRSRLGRRHARRHGAPRAAGGSSDADAGRCGCEADQRLTAQPDVVRHDHADARRFVILGSPGVWTQGPRLPLQWAVEAYRSGRRARRTSWCGGARGTPWRSCSCCRPDWAARAVPCRRTAPWREGLRSRGRRGPVAAAH